MCHWVQFPSPWKGTQELVQTERKNSGKHKATAKSEDKFLKVNNLCDRHKAQAMNW